MHSKIFSATDATIDAHRSHVSKLVSHGGLPRALAILRESRHVLIVGKPGIGKTTLARMIMCHYLSEGFEPIWVTGNIEEAWSIVNGSIGSDRKIIIVYDDFLGQAKFESVRFAKNEDNSLINLINKAERSSNLRIILTTREYILEDARNLHGAFHSHSTSIARCTISLEDYTKPHRAKMLFNHLYFSDLPDDRLVAFVKNAVYREIVDHKFFNPRVVEHICKHANSKALTDEEYLKFIREEFDDPSKLWRHPFQSEIGPLARIALVALWTFGGQVDLTAFRECLGTLTQHETAEEALIGFEKALRQLDGNFIQIGRYRTASYTKDDYVFVVQFQNPSIEEFINGVVKADARHWLQRYAGVPLSLRQIERILGAYPCSGHGVGDSRDFWIALRARAMAVQTNLCGSLVNWQAYNSTSSYRAWMVSQSSPINTRLLVCKLNKCVGSDDDASKRIISSLGDVEQWVNLLSSAVPNPSHFYPITNLIRWIVRESGWSEFEKNNSQITFRLAAFRILASYVADDMEVSTIDSLVEAVRDFGLRLASDERDLVLAVVKMRVDSASSQSENLDMLYSEASELKALSKRIGLNLEAQVAQLNQRAASVEDEQRSNDWSSDDDAPKFDADPSTPIDLDLLFSALLER